MHHEGERHPTPSSHDLQQRIRDACCDISPQDVDVDEHAKMIAREVARAEQARSRLMSSRRSS